MWKKPTPAPSSPAPQAPVSDTSPLARPEPPRAAAPSKSRIGPGVVLRGEIQGQEDLVVEGRVEGRIAIEQHMVVVESAGRVDADISARVVRVAGEVRGNITASEQAVLLETARLEGDIASPGVTIETGARFKGSIDMDANAAKPVTPPRREPAPVVVSKPNGSAKPVGVA